ncbi:MAG: TolC family protein [Phycisphaerae bacterium]
MTAKMLIPLALATVFVPLWGCTHIQPKAAFASVQSTIAAHTGQPAVWNEDSADDRAASAAVAKLLAHPLSAEQAVAVALLQNPQVQSMYEDLGIAQADLVQAGLLRNPVFSIEVRFPGRPHFPLEANLDREFLDLLYLPMRKKLAQAQFEQAQYQVSARVLSLTADVRRRYFRLQGAMQLLALRQHVLEAQGAAQTTARAIHAAGNTQKIDLNTQLAAYEQAKLDLADAQGQVALAREDLAEVLGIWGTTEVSVPPRLPEMPPSDRLPGNLEAAALKGRLDLAAARAALLAEARALGITQATALFNGGTLGIHYQRDADVKGTLGPNLSVPLPLFDQGQAAVARNNARFRQLNDDYQALAVSVRREVRRAAERLALDRERVTFLHDVMLPLRKQIGEETQRLYNGMYTGAFQLIEAKEVEIQSAEAYVQALQDYWLARTDLDQALTSGNPERGGSMDAGGSSLLRSP